VKTSIIIPLYKSRPYIPKLVENLNRVAPNAQRIWVSDGDGVYQELGLRHAANDEFYTLRIWVSDGDGVYQELGLRHAANDKFYTLSEHRGFSRTVNAGAELALGEYLLLLNADALLGDGFLAEISEYPESSPQNLTVRRMLGMEEWLDMNPHAGIAAPAIFQPGGRIDSLGSRWNFENQWWEHIGYGEKTHPDLERGKAIERDMVTFACVMIRRKLWCHLKGLDEIYSPCYWEDSDFCMRAREMGTHIFVLPWIHAVHIGNSAGFAFGESFQRNAERYRKQWIETGRQWKFIKDTRQRETMVIMRYRGAGDVLAATSLANRVMLKYPDKYEISFVTEEPDVLFGQPNIAKLMRPYDINQAHPDDWKVVNLNWSYETQPTVTNAEAFAIAAEMPELNTPELLELGRPRILAENIGDEERTWAKAVREKSGKPMIAIHYGPCAWPSRNWPNDRWAQLVTTMKEKEYTLVEITPEIVPMGMSRVMATAALLQECVAFIGIDSFPAHIAQAVDTPAVVLFGPTEARRVLHGNPNLTLGIQGKGAECSSLPCDSSGPRRAPERRCLRMENGYAPCMLSITAEEVVKRMNEVLRYASNKPHKEIKTC